MPSYWTGTLDDRLSRLDKVGRRCDANSRNCPNPAVEEYDLWEADGFGNKKPDAKLIQRKSCGRHRSQFVRSGLYIVSGTRKLGSADSPRRATAAAHVRFSAAADSPGPSWTDFIKACNDTEPGIFAQPGGYARLVRHVDEISIIATTPKGNNVLVDVGKRLGVVVYV